MNQRKIEILIVIGIITLCLVYVGLNFWQDRRAEKETVLRTESEMRYKQLVVQYDSTQKLIDSLKTERISLQAVIEFQKNNPNLIIKNNDKIHLDINKLSALNAIKLFSDNISDYDNFRSRYSLHRFHKDDK